MPGYFFDSSALAKHYHVEVRSVSAGKVRTGVITEDAFRLLRRRFLADVTTRQIFVLVLMRND